ncbi:TPA: autotransporter outer membrane beta-barrel domain-containing protein, partial [Campylobacter jejuni]
MYTNNTKFNTFTNSGTISSNGSHSNGSETIYFMNTNISSFTNSGTISSDSSDAIYFVNTDISSFTNTGTIKGSYGVSGIATIDTLTNQGAIIGSNMGIFALKNIKTLINSGTITTTVDSHANAGIKLQSGGTIDNIINTGTIESGSYGIAVSYGKFGTLTIKDGGIVNGKIAGIDVGQWQRLGDLYIDGTSLKKDGSVSGVYGGTYGISLRTGASTQKIELSNGGVIQGDKSGIGLINAASLSGDMILSGEGSRVKGRRGAAISNEGGKISGSVTIKDGATIGSDSGQAIENSGSGTVTGGITISGSNTKLEGNIVNTDNASIGSDIKVENGAQVEGGLVNKGNGSITGSVQVSGGSSIESITNEGSGSISGSITVDKDSKLDSITNTSSSSTGISGSITNNSDNDLSISNSGNIGGKIESTGSADMTISNSGGTISGGISSSGSGNTSISNSQGSTIDKGITVSGRAKV